MKLEAKLLNIYHAILNKEFVANQSGMEAHPDYELSAINLVRYITLRNIDLRNIHDHLSELGISSLRSCEGYVWSNVTSALRLVKLLKGEVWEPEKNIKFIGYSRSKKLLRKHSKQLFNTKKRKHLTKIMVTMPLEAAHQPELIQEMLSEGMEIARINLSYGTKEEWNLLVKHIREQSALMAQPCQVYMDLSGPKIRTGEIQIKRTKKGVKNFIRLKKGDHLFLTTNENKSKDSKYGTKGELIIPPEIGVSLPSIIKDAKVGDKIFFDDGKIESKVIKKKASKLEVLILNGEKKGIKLKAGKGINLPETKLKLSSLTDDDIQNLPFVMEHADILGYSFVRKVADIQMLYAELEKFDRKDIGIVLKIENKESFDNLPMLLLEAMKRPRIGVMIARGDLAVEIGPERIAEVQDQIMWICEAAHIPVIWATQVLETLANKGKATRAEITDAAKSARAECVMLNKGPYITKAIKMLSQILSKMESHTSKKKSVMRALNVSKDNVDRIGRNMENNIT